MLSIGLDIGTGFVKCVSDTKKIKFPSLYAYKWIEEWNKTKKLVEAVGYDAVALSVDPDVIVIKPVMLGRPVHEKAFVELVKKAVLVSSESNDAIDSKLDHIAIGLPYDAVSYRTSIQKMITKLYRPKTCDVVPQVLGTLADAGYSSAVVMSIGQGTTEIVGFIKNKAIRGTSVHHAVEFISSKFGAMSYLDNFTFENKRTGELVTMLVDYLVNELHHVRQDMEKLPVIVSGGGILVPGMEKAIRAKFKDDIIIPQDPVMSNALGLYKIASWYAKQD